MATNGAAYAPFAIYRIAQSFNQIEEVDAMPHQSDPERAVNQLHEQSVSTVADTPVSQLAVGVRAKNAFAQLGILTVGQLQERTALDLLAVKYFGVTAYQEVKEALRLLGVTLKDD